MPRRECLVTSKAAFASAVARGREWHRRCRRSQRLHAVQTRIDVTVRSRFEIDTARAAHGMGETPI